MGSEADQADAETEWFFRAVDRAILEQYSRPSGLRLLLAGLPEQLSLFRRISQNPFLMDEGIDGHPEAMSLEDLRDRAWRAVEPHYLTRLAGLTEMFETARPRELGDDDLSRIAGARWAGEFRLC